MSCIKKRGSDFVICRIEGLSPEVKAALAVLVAAGILRVAHDIQWHRELTAPPAAPRFEPPLAPAYNDNPREVDLDGFLSVYKHKQAKGLAKGHYDMCVRALKADLHRQTFLSVEDGSNREHVRKSLWHRVPVYFGEPKPNYYSEQRFQEVHGLTTEYVMLSANRRADARYIICGPVATAETGPAQWWVAHAWGPNLESTRTADARIFFGKNCDNPGAAEAWYFGRVQKLYLNVFKTAREVVRRSRVRRVVVRLPAIGQGAFLSAVRDKAQRKRLVHLHQSALRVAANAQPDDRVTVSLAYLDGDVPDPGSDRIAVGPGNLFNVNGLGGLASTAVVLVNAWDNQSFVGNGLLGDPTIDGMMVAGQGPGSAFPNSSYTHNAFLSTHLFDSKRWVV